MRDDGFAPALPTAAIWTFGPVLLTLAPFWMVRSGGGFDHHSVALAVIVGGLGLVVAPVIAGLVHRSYAVGYAATTLSLAWALFLIWPGLRGLDQVLKGYWPAH